LEEGEDVGEEEDGDDRVGGVHGLEGDAAGGGTLDVDICSRFLTASTTIFSLFLDFLLSDSSLRKKTCNTNKFWHEFIYSKIAVFGLANKKIQNPN